MKTQLAGPGKLGSASTQLKGQCVAMGLFENIPEELTQLKQWVCWRVIERDGKQTKMPVQPNGSAASSTDPKTWSTFEQVCAARGMAGVGFVFTKGAGFTGIDLDKCRHPQTGDTEPWALKIIEELNSYSEISQSGKGWHVIVRGNLPSGRNRAGRIEMYDSARFFVMTGNTVFGTGLDIILQRDLSSLQKKMAEGSLEPKRAKPTQAKIDDSVEDFRLIGEVQKQINVTDADTLEEEFRKRYPERYATRNREKGERAGRNYFRYTIDNFLSRNPFKPNSETGIQAETFDNIKEKALLWFWRNRLPLNKLVVFGGNPDAGKSLVSQDISARATKGRDFPDGEKNELGPIEVALLFCEDDAQDTVKPRLMAADADCSRVHRLYGTAVDKDGSQKERQIAFDTDLPKIERFLLEHRAIRFLVVDPISNYLGEASMVKETEVRGVLIPLAELAARLEVTVLLIAHLNKRSDVSALHKIMGAVAISGVARAAWLFAEDPENEGSYLMVRGKLNVGKKTEGLRYSIGVKSIPDIGEVPFIKWEGTTDVSAGQVLGLFGPMDSNRGAKRSDAATWLEEMLSAGRKPTDDILAAAKRQGIAEKTLRRAKKQLGVVAVQDADCWYWEFPSEGSDGHAG